LPKNQVTAAEADVHLFRLLGAQGVPLCEVMIEQLAKCAQGKNRLVAECITFSRDVGKNLSAHQIVVMALIGWRQSLTLG